MKYNSFITNELACADSVFDNTPRLEALARKSGWMRRASRNFSPAQLLRSLIAEACSGNGTFNALSMACGALTSSQNIHQRINKQATDFLASVLSNSLNTIPDNKASSSPFGRVIVEDCSHFQAPISLAQSMPSYGNQFTQTAGVKLHFAYDLLNGSTLCADLIQARTSDQSLAQKCIDEHLRPGDLLIRDKGFFSVDALTRIHFAGAFYLSRLPRSLKPMNEDLEPLDLVALLDRSERDFVECVACIGQNTGLPTRLIAMRVPKQIAAQRTRECRQRLKQSRGKLPAKERIHCHWELVVTNVPFAIMESAQLVSLYRCRWRIELVFKALKSGNFSGRLASTAPINITGLPSC